MYPACNAVFVRTPNDEPMTTVPTVTHFSGKEHIAYKAFCPLDHPVNAKHRTHVLAGVSNNPW